MASLHLTLPSGRTASRNCEFGPKLTEKGFAQRLRVFLRVGSGFLMSAVQPLTLLPANFTGASVAKPKATKKEGS